MLLMQIRYGQLKRGYSRQDFYSLVEEVYEGSLADIWTVWVESADPLNDAIEALLKDVGLKFEAQGSVKIVDMRKLDAFRIAL
jgi:hypothetical protein